MTLDKAKAKRLVDLVLAQASFGDVRVRITSSRRERRSALEASVRATAAQEIRSPSSSG